MGRQEYKLMDEYTSTPEGEKIGNKLVRVGLVITAILAMTAFVGVVVAFLLGWNP